MPTPLPDDRRAAFRRDMRLYQRVRRLPELIARADARAAALRREAAALGLQDLSA